MTTISYKQIRALQAPPDQSIKDLEIRDPEVFVPVKGRMPDPACGPFDLLFLVWDLDAQTLKETIGRHFYNMYVSPFTGVRIFRDGFRVWPYGERDDDWLSMDLRRVNDPTHRLSRNQIVGMAGITGESNPCLVDKTNREGLKENDAFEHFRSLVISALSVLEIERRRDKDVIDELRGLKKARTNPTIEAIDGLTVKMKELGHSEIYHEDVDKVRRAHETQLRNLMDPLLISAGIGISFLMPIHEVTRGLTDLESLLDRLEQQLNIGQLSEEAQAKLIESHELLSSLRKVASGALDLGRRASSIFSLVAVANAIVSLASRRASESGVRLEVVGDSKLRIRGVRALIQLSVSNLVDNSLHWLQTIEGEKRIRIKIDRNLDGRLRIVVSDTGPGIHREDLPYLGEEIFTRKSNGTGLGLLIVKRAMRAHDGDLQFLFQEDESDLLKGANVELLFPSKVEVAS
jgi:signal transduction histidine kinase